MSQTILTAWQRLIRMLSLDKREVFQVFYYAIFAGLVNLSLPLGIQMIINLIQGAQVSTSWVVLVVLVTLGVVFAGTLQLMQVRLLENIQQKIFTRASFEFTFRFPKIRMGQLNNFYPPELANRFFDILTVQKGLPKILIDFPSALLQMVFGLILLSFYHPFFIAYGLLLMLLVYIVFKYTGQKGMDTSILESKYKYQVAHWVQEVARSIVSFKLSGRTSHAVDRNDALTADYLDARENHFRVLVRQFIYLIGFKVLVTAGLLVIGGLLVLDQEMNIGQFVAAEIIIILVMNSVEKMILGLETFYDLLTSMEKLGQVVDREIEPLEGENPFSRELSVAVELDNVCYHVPGRGKTVVDKVSLKVEPGETLFLRGPNGSGKSTVLRLIAGIMEPDSGAIYVNGIHLKRVDLPLYRSQIGHSLSEESPFEGTLLENLTFGDDSLDIKEVYHALDVVGLTAFVRELPDGLATMVYPEGKKIPDIVAKKIVLARSIVRRPKLLLLKDPLDQFAKEEADRIMRYLTDPGKGWSLIVVSGNARWSKYCTRHLYMENGVMMDENGKRHA